MKSRVVAARVTALGILVLLIGCTTNPPPAPVPRPAQSLAGTARWAYAVAQLPIVTFSQDAELYTINGALILPDGRLPANMGEWSFLAWSPSLKKKYQVTVRFDRSLYTTTGVSSTPPSQNGRPIPLGWADSRVVFAAMKPHLRCGVTIAQLAVVNVASYAEAPNEQLWAVHFDVGQNHLVRWDGTYIGQQGTPDVPC